MRRALAALIVFVTLACVHTWPLASNPAHLSRNDNADTVLNTWAIAWVAHELPRHPTRLFDANIFYPERRSLGYSEAMIVQGVLAMPVLAAGGSPVLAYNLVLLAGFALTGWAFWWLVRRWTGSEGAAYVAGSAAAFNAHVLVRLPHLQTQHPEFIALALFALDRLLTDARAKSAVVLAVAYALQALTSVYLLVFTTWLLMFAALGRAREWLTGDRRRTAWLLAGAGVLAAVLLAPYLGAYLEIRRTLGFERGVGDSQEYAASWVDYLATGGRLHYGLWSAPFVGRTISDNFPGVTAFALATLAFVWDGTPRDRRVRMCALAALGCIAVSLVPRTPIFPALYAVIPLFRAVRVISHIGQLVLLMVAVLAGFGTAGLLRRIQQADTRWAVAVAAVALVNIEALRAPLDYERFDQISAVYDVIAREPRAVVVELPFFEARQSFANARYMLNSTRHWKPLLNGYSGFRPPSYDVTYEAIRDFPEEAALRALRAQGVTHVVLHQSMLPEPTMASAARAYGLHLLAEEDGIVIYRLE